jgi:PPOX class probable F420-dependent enzyme
VNFDDVKPFFQEHHRGVVITHRRNGSAQASIVKIETMNNAAVFVVRGNSAKLANLKRDLRCTAMATMDDWGGYAVVEGEANLSHWDNTDPEALRLLLREAFRACGGSHPDWDEYDRAMRRERRTVVMVHPTHVYGFARQGSR